MSSVIELLISGGVLIIPIAVCSVVSVGITIERLLCLRRTRAENAQFLAQIRGNVRIGRIEDSIAICQSSPSPLSRVFLSALRRISDGEDTTRQAVEDAGRTETAELERHLGGLATIAGGAPLVGFLGTVIGMIEAFQTVEKLGGNVNASVLAGGIWQALLTTAAGLIVAVPTFFAHNYLHARVQSEVRMMEEKSKELMLLLVTGDESLL